MSELVATNFEDGVLHVTLSRPEKRNALSNALIAAIGATFSKWSERDDVSVAVLTGSGDKAFASGGDLKELESLRDETGTIAFAARTRAALAAALYTTAADHGQPHSWSRNRAESAQNRYSAASRR